jgi:hypothetical protein
MGCIFRVAAETQSRSRAAHSNPERSGVGLERALEANTLIHRAQRENPSSPEPPQRAKARPCGAHKKPRSPLKPRAERGRAGASLGRRTPSSIAHSAKTHPPQSLLSERRLDPAELTKNYAAHPNPERSGVGLERALEANTLIHRAQRENPSSPEPPQRAKA